MSTQRLFLVFAILFAPLAAADGFFDWVAGIGGVGVGGASAIAVDGGGRSYLSGVFTGTIDLDPGSGTAFVSTPGSAYYVVKLNSNGDYVWGFKLDATVHDMALDAPGTLHIVGSFNGTQDFDPGGGTAELTAAGGEDAFVLKVSSAGAFDAVFALSGTDDEVARAIAVTDAGVMHVAGSFTGTTDFDPSGSTAELTATGGEDLFVAKYTATETYTWATATDGGDLADTVLAGGIEIDSQDAVAIAGTFDGRIDFDSGAGSLTIANSTYPALDDEAFVAKYDSSGVIQWAHAMGGDASDAGFDVVIDAGDKVHVTGVFEGTADFDPSLSTEEETSAGLRDIFHAVLDTDGDYVWHVAIGGTGDDFAYSTVRDEDGNLLTTGTFKESVDFDPGAGSTVLVASNAGSAIPYSDVFVWKLDSSGLFQFAKGIGNQLGNSALRIGADANGATFTYGYFQGTLDFDPGAGTSNLSVVSSFDSFLLKLDGGTGTIWVDFGYVGAESGTDSQPYNTVAEGLAAVPSNGTVRIKGNTGAKESSETMTINQSVTLRSDLGIIRIGI